MKPFRPHALLHLGALAAAFTVSAQPLPYAPWNHFALAADGVQVSGDQGDSGLYRLRIHDANRDLYFDRASLGPLGGLRFHAMDIIGSEPSSSGPAFAILFRTMDGPNMKLVIRADGSAEVLQGDKPAIPISPGKVAPAADPAPARVPSRTFTVPTNHGITAITLMRGACLGSCPSYTFTIARDGRVDYEGGPYAPYAGKRTGHIPAYVFHRIASFLDQSDFFGMAPSYSDGIVDGPSVSITVERNGVRQGVDADLDAAPNTFWVAEHALYDVLGQVAWAPKPARGKGRK